MMVACRLKPVEQLRNIGIINSTTQSHLVVLSVRFLSYMYLLKLTSYETANT